MADERPQYPRADPSLSYDLAKNELSILLSSVDALDNKIASGASLATALIAILLTFIGIRTGQNADIISTWSVGLVAATSAAYVGSAVFFGLAFWRSTWEIGLTARDARIYAEPYKDHPEILYWWATNTLIESLDHNHEQYRRKQNLTTIAFVLLVAELCLGASAITVTFA